MARRTFLRRTLLRAGKGCVGLCVANTFFTLVGYPASVNGASMCPTLNDPEPRRAAVSCDVMHRFRQSLPTFLTDDWIWISCLAARKFIKGDAPAPLPRGLVIVFTSPKNPAESIIKRVIAREDDVIRNAGRTIVIPKGHCWVEGDNATSSVDSRKYGSISVGLIIGVATHIIFPIRRIRALDSNEPVYNQSTVLVHKHEKHTGTKS